MNKPYKCKAEPNWLDRLTRLVELVMYALYWSIVCGTLLLTGALLQGDPHKGIPLKRVTVSALHLIEACDGSVLAERV